MKVIFEKKGPIAYVTINRPERLNACDFETYGLLADYWREFRDDPELRVAILTGAGERAFCAGSDVKSNYVERPGIEPHNAPFAVMFDLYKPIIAALTVTRTGADSSRLWPATFGSPQNMRNSAWVKCGWDGCRAAVALSDCRG